MSTSATLADSDTRARIGPWHPDRLPSLDAFEPDTNFLVRAAAGSGKTTALVGRLVALVRRGVPLDDCAAITFTRKAASEMRARLYSELRRTLTQLRNSGDFPRQERRVAAGLNNLPQCFIGTIHAFCTRLLREQPLAAGLPPDFTAGLDARERDEMRRRVWHSYLSTVWENEPERVDQVVSLGIEPAELDHFFGELCRYPDLAAFVDGPDSPPDLDATVDSLSEKVDAWIEALPDDPADGNAKPGAAASAVRTAHRMLRVSPMEDPATKASFVELFDGLTKPDSRKSTESTVRGNITKGHWEDPDLAKELDDTLLPTLERDVVRPALRRWRSYAHRQLVSFVRPAVSRYADHRRQTGRLTFQDLLVCARDLLRDRLEARRRLQDQYPRLLVDEFQDTDPVQAEILFYLAGRDPNEVDWRKCRPRNGSLFVVGDDKQSIYRFRRADLDVYSTVRTLIGDADNGEDVVLKSNFRSSPSLLEWCNDAFSPIFGERDAPFQASYVPFTAARTDDPESSTVFRLEVPYVKGSSSTRAIAGRNAEQIARLISDACSDSPNNTRLVGSSPGDFMVLTRNTTRLDEFAETFAEHKIPYTLAGGDDVKASSELFALVSLLKCIERPQDPVARLAYLRGPLVGLSDDDLYRIREAGGDYSGPLSVSPAVAERLAPPLAERLTQAYEHLRWAADRLEKDRPASALERIVERLGLMARTRRDPGRGSLHAGRLLRVLSEVQRLDADGLPWTAIRDELEQILEGDRSLDGLTLETGASDAVRLLNVHKAKGLEAPVVFLADPYGGSDPKDPDEHVRRDEGDVVLPVYEEHRFNRTLRFAPQRWETEFQDTEAKYQRAEEDRLLYVAATRAEDQLVVSRYRSSSWSTEKGYWAPLYTSLADVPTIDPPASSEPAGGSSVTAEPQPFSPDERERIRPPSYRLSSVTEAAGTGHQQRMNLGYGADFGIAVHELFEYVVRRRQRDRFSSSDLDSLVEAVLDNREVPDKKEPASRMLRSFLDSTLWEDLRHASPVHTELSVADLDGQTPPVLTEGTIDLLYRLDGKWHLVDYKTDRVASSDDAAIPPQYREQLRTYGEMWENATGTRIEELALWLADVAEKRTVE